MNNLLLSGYLREHQEQNVQIPHLVTSVISDYMKQYKIQRLGYHQNKINISGSFEKIIIDQASDACASKVFKTNSTNIKADSNLKWIQSVLDYQSDFFDELDTSNINLSDIQEHIIDIKYGSNHILFLTSAGTCYAIGSNNGGACGFDKQVIHLTNITLIPFDQKIISIACGHNHSLFINENNQLLACGNNFCGALGIEPVENDNNLCIEVEDSDSEDEWEADEINNFVFTPTLVRYFEDNRIKIKGISCGGHHSLCITTDGDVYTFGHNGFYNLGNGKCTEWGAGEYIPNKLDINGKHVVDASCGTNHSVLITNMNEIIVFGDNRDNQCSNINHCEEIKTPYILSKDKEFNKNRCYIEKVVCMKDETLLLLDQYTHI